MLTDSGSTFYLSPECQGRLFEPVEAYSTAQADLWSLGVILVNLACGRNPWRQACADDETFRAYLEDPNLLSTILPLSQAASNILAGLFAQNPNDRISITTLRAMVVAAPNFSTHRRVNALPSPPQTPITDIDNRLSDIANASHWSHTECSDIYSHVSPTWAYSGLPSHHPFSTTPASTPGLVDSSLDPFNLEQRGRQLSTSTVGSVPPTPELGPTVPTLEPAPQPRWGKKARREEHLHHCNDDENLGFLRSAPFVL